MGTTLGKRARSGEVETSDSRVFFFAYSVNMHKQRVQGRCPSVRVIGPAELRDHRLGFTRYSSRWMGGVADVIPDAGQSVWGLLYFLESADLAKLDVLQHYPEGYDRKQTTVWLRVSDPPAPEAIAPPDLPRSAGSIFDDFPPPAHERYEAVDSAWVYFVANPLAFVPPTDTYLYEMLLASLYYRFPLSYRRHIASFLGQTVEAEALYSILADLANELNRPDSANR